MEKTKDFFMTATAAQFVALVCVAAVLLAAITPASAQALPDLAAPVSVMMTKAAEWPVRLTIWTGKVALYTGLFIGVGGAFFVSWIGGRSLPAVYTTLMALSIGLVVTPLSVGLHGLEMLGEGLVGLGRADAWEAGYAESYGMTALISMAALTAALVAIAEKGIIGKFLSLAALLGVGLALAASGHASAVNPQWLMRPAVFLHGVGIAFWVGSLIPLGAAFGARGCDSAEVLRRFSAAIPLGVLPLVAAGMVLALLQLGKLDVLWGTAYGQVLMIKFALLAGLFVLAGINRFWLTERAARGDPRSTELLRRSIRGEVGLVLAIFAVAALWRLTPPPHPPVEAAVAPASIGAVNGVTQVGSTAIWVRADTKRSEM